VLVAVEAGWRAWRATPVTRLGESLLGILLVAVGVTIAGGLGILVAGGSPREPLHFLYAALAFGAVPVANSLTRDASSRRRAVVTLIGAVVGFVVIVRSFQTA
jgi:hypothetical protein